MTANERVYTNVIDKSAWGDGPWQTEPDKIQWADPDTGLPCMIVRGPGGQLCGYVGLTEGHPFFEKGYSDCTQAACNSDWHYDCSPGGQVEVHGGLTYADHCQPGPERSAICHVPEPGQSDHVWWLGFDCAHLDDLTPKYGSYVGAKDTYRTVDYVRGEVTNLAHQLESAAKT